MGRRQNQSQMICGTTGAVSRRRLAEVIVPDLQPSTILSCNDNELLALYD